MIYAFILGAMIIVHHIIITGYAVDPGDILHHEFFAGVLIAFALGIMYALGLIIKRR